MGRDLLPYEIEEHKEQNVIAHPELLDGLTFVAPVGDACPICELMQRAKEYTDAKGQEWREYPECGFLELIG